jgi:hypothetical protein
MNKIFLAKLQWTKPEEGGLKSKPIAPRFVAPVRFDGKPFPLDESVWSLVVEFLEIPDETLTHLVHVSYLMDNAPHETLRPGRVFELAAGDRVFAKGTILEPIVEET